VAPHAIVQLLRYCSTQPWGADYKATFPIAGVDGSLTERLRVAAAAQSHHGENRLAGRGEGALGFATTDGGEVVVFSILSNNFNLPAKRVTDAIDELVQAIVEDTPGGH